jgi:hypothetical protein
VTWLGRVHVVAEGVVMGEWAYLWGQCTGLISWLIVLRLR